MKKNMVSIGILLIFSILSISFESQLINPETVNSYSILYQPFIILGPGTLMNELIPIVILLAVFTMYFMGGIRKDLYSSGMYYILRYGSKRKWLNKKLTKVSIELLLLVCGYYLISTCVALIYFREIASGNLLIVFMQIIIFYLAFLALMQIQIALEMYFTETIANTLVLMGAFIMINLYGVANELNLVVVKYIMFVNNISIMRSGVLKSNGTFVILALIILNLVIYSISQLLIKKKDIF